MKGFLQRQYNLITLTQTILKTKCHIDNIIDNNRNIFNKMSNKKLELDYLM